MNATGLPKRFIVTLSCFRTIR